MASTKHKRQRTGNEEHNSNTSSNVSITTKDRAFVNRLVVSRSEDGEKFPPFREPTEIGRFSLDGHRQIHFDHAPLKYLVLPPEHVELDLNVGYEQVVKKTMDNHSEKIDNILKWILKNKNKFAIHETSSAENQPVKDFRLHTDFVCFRGLLTSILCTPYERREGWLICATKHRGTIYLCAFNTDKERERMEKETDRDRRMSSWGYKFEQYLTSAKPNVKPNTESPVNENEEYCSMVRTRLHKHSLVYGAEVDGVDSEHTDSHPDDVGTTRSYIELKTSREITNSRQDMNFKRYKLLKWWAQSFLIGIPKIICGFRDDDGIVHTLQTFQTQDIPKYAKDLWLPAVCMNFCDSFLTFVKQSVHEDNPRVAYKFEWKPGDDVKCTLLANPGSFEILPEWYIESLQK